MRKLLRRLIQWLMTDQPDKSDPTPDETTAVDRLDYYCPKERRIFYYYDGEKVREADPMVLFRRYDAVRADFVTAYKVAQSPAKDAGAEAVKAAGMIHSVFGTRPFEQGQGGLTEDEVYDLLYKFMDYCESVKKNSSQSPTSPAETSPTSESSSDEPCATSSSSPSGSCGTDNSTGRPPSWPTESPSAAARNFQDSSTAAT